MNSKVYAIISDIHGNEEALRAVLEVIRSRNVDEIVCLGDVVGYGASVNECMKLVRENCRRVVQGNHDGEILPPRNPRMRQEAIEALQYAQKVLDKESIDWLLALPHPLVIDETAFLAVHGAITGRDNYILAQKDVNDNLDLLENDYPQLNVAFFGHSHLPMILARAGVLTTFSAPETELSLMDNDNYLINPGSVGQPRDGVNKASFAIYDTQRQAVSILRVDYDIEKEQEKMRRAGLADKTVERIARGR